MSWYFVKERRSGWTQGLSTSNRPGRTGSGKSRIDIPRRHSNVSEPTSIRSLTSDSKGDVFNNGILKEYPHAGL